MTDTPKWTDEQARERAMAVDSDFLPGQASGAALDLFGHALLTLEAQRDGARALRQVSEETALALSARVKELEQELDKMHEVSLEVMAERDAARAALAAAERGTK